MELPDNTFMFEVYFKYMDGKTEAQRAIYIVHASNAEEAERLLLEHKSEITDERIENISRIAPREGFLNDVIQKAASELNQDNPVKWIVNWSLFPGRS